MTKKKSDAEIFDKSYNVNDNLKKINEAKNRDEIEVSILRLKKKYHFDPEFELDVYYFICKYNGKNKGRQFSDFKKEIQSRITPYLNKSFSYYTKSEKSYV